MERCISKCAGQEINLPTILTSKGLSSVMELKLELICIGHITPRSDDCKSCKTDEYNSNCPRYLSRKEAIKVYRPDKSPVGEFIDGNLA